MFDQLMIPSSLLSKKLATRSRNECMRARNWLKPPEKCINLHFLQGVGFANYLFNVLTISRDLSVMQVYEFQRRKFNLLFCSQASKGRLYTAANDGSIRVWDASKIRDDEDLEEEESETIENNN